MSAELLPRLRCSLKYRIAAIIFILEAIMISAVLGFSLSHSLEKSRAQLALSEKVTLKLLSDLSRIALLTGEYDDLQPYIDQVVKDPHIDTVFLSDVRNRIVVSSQHNDIGKTDSASRRLPAHNRIWRSQAIGNTASELGRLYVRFSQETLLKTSREVLKVGVTTALAGMTLIAVIGVLIGFLLTRRLDILAKSALRVAQGETNVRANLTGNDEVAIVGHAFDQMAQGIQENLQALENAASELEKRVEERTKELEVTRDKAIQADLSKTAFLANMSHEIRTPLTAIIGFSESLLDLHQPMPERVESIHTIIRSGKHLLKIINDILDLSKIEANHLEIENVDINLFALTEEVGLLVRLMAEEKDIAFKFEYVLPLPEFFQSDPVRLKQILINLCNNAIKFTHHGSVILKVQYLQIQHQLQFVITDTGIGLDEQQLKRLFRPFAQGDSSTSRKYGGTGLGLHLSRNLCLMLGGDLEVHSVAGLGSSFSATVACSTGLETPWLTALPSSALNMPNAIQPRIPLLAGKILLAEDNCDNQRLITMYIRATGADVEVVSDGSDAVNRALLKPYDLILMDIQMPVKDGLTATRELRASGYKGAIVALTANTMNADIALYENAGCTQHFSKPINRVEFYAMLTKYLHKGSVPLQDYTPIHSRLLDEDPDLIDLVQEFVRRLPRKLDEIKAFAHNNDMPRLKAAVHDLKGSSGNFGYNQVRDKAQQIEFEIAANNPASITTLIAELDNIYACILTGLKQHKKAS